MEEEFKPILVRMDVKTKHVSELVRMFQISDIVLENVSPVSDMKASSLIESMLLRISIGDIYADIQKDGVWYVFDGSRKLKIIFDFLNGAFILDDMEYFPAFSNMSFDELPRHMQRRILEYTIHCELIDSEVPEDTKMNLKKRIKTSLYW